MKGIQQMGKHWSASKRVFQRLGGAGIQRFRPRGGHQNNPFQIGLHCPLHGRQACAKFTSFHQGVGQISPLEGLFSCCPLSKRGRIRDTPAPPNRRTTQTREAKQIKLPALEIINNKLHTENVEKAVLAVVVSLINIKVSTT